MSVNIRLRSWWDDAQSSLWLRPTLITVGSILLAVGSITIDQQFNLPKFFSAGADDARAVLSAIASSMLTVTSVTFSIIMVALVMASQQFSPRILRNFMRDRASQNVLGVFIGAFIYSLLVLGRVSDYQDFTFVPVFSVTVSLLFTVVSVGAFIYFVHHIAQTIQVNHIVAEINKQTEELLDKTFPQLIGTPPAAQDEPPQPPANAATVTALRSGYLQAIDPDGLLGLACRHNAVICLDRKIGDFIPKDAMLAHVWPPDVVSRSFADEFHDIIDIGSDRTLFEDLLYGIRQLVDIALKAISPAINDPNTAVNVINYLSSLLVQAVQRPNPSPYRYDSQHTLRVIAPITTFADLIDAAFNQIRQYSASEVSVTLHLLIALVEIARVTPDAGRWRVLWHHAHMISRNADHGIQEPADRLEINQRIRCLAEIIDQPPGMVLLNIDDAALAAE